MFTCGYLKYISLLILVNVGQILRTESAPVLVTNRRVPVEGVSFSITCTLDAAINETVRFFKDTSIQGGCLSSGICSSSVSGYSVSLDSTSRIPTLDIASPYSTRDSGTWSCATRTTGSNSITLSHIAAVLDWRSVTFSPQLTSLPSSVAPQNTISVTVTTPCAAPAAFITWRYQQGVSGVPPSSTSSSKGSCPSDKVQTTNTLSLPGNPASLSNYCFVFTGREWRPSQQYIFLPGIMSIRPGPDNQHTVSTRKHSQSLQQTGVSHYQCGTRLL
ncbi:mucin-5AC-like [Haliotis cracherodii]|uniref:mucin-5AC-like n=1 Tax=Haliotis cracherodii TaxID=6455 RepID=UPI0039E7C85C